VLIFVAPASRLAQPWAVVAGNTLAALVGAACWAVLPTAVVAGPLAAMLATVAMFVLRCLHPPGGAVALLVVLASASGGHLGAGVVLANSIVLVAAGLVFNPLTGRRYPHAQMEAPAGAQAGAARFSSADLDAVLRRYNQVLDVSRDDLEGLLLAAEFEGYRRRVGHILCRDVMTASVVTVQPDTPLREAWDLMAGRRIKALPVIAPDGSITGILTIGDVLRALRAQQGAGPLPAPGGGNGPDAGPDSPYLLVPVRVLMSGQVRVAREDQSAVDLLPLFADAGHHHIPVVNERQQVVGIITESDFVRALYRHPVEADAP